MADSIDQAIFAIKSGDSSRGRRLLTELLQTDPANDRAWVWLAKSVTTPEWRRACLDRALALNPANPEAQQALLDWIAADHELPAPAGAPVPPPTPSAPVAPPSPSPTPALATNGLPVTAGLKDLFRELRKNFNVLKRREARYANAAPLDLLNQIDDYQQAIDLTERAMTLNLPVEELQAEFAGLNLQISTVVFVDKEPPRKKYTGVNPYRGLRKFTEDEASYFFGRTAAIDNLLNTTQYLLETPTSHQMPDLIAVLGPSGSGKSSLVRAGLIPALRAGRLEGSQDWPIRVMLPGERPMNALAEVFLGQSDRDLTAIRQILEGEPQGLHTLMVESLQATPNPDHVVFVLVIDQFEELFTLCDDETERRAFIDQILTAACAVRNRGFIILTMRSDFYSKVAAYKPLAEAVTQHQMLVSPMTEKELREAILLPAEAVGLELEKALVETLLKDTADSPAVLPLLQETLTELFNRRDGNLLTLEAYNQIGGVKGALAHKADGIIEKLSMDERHIVRRIFMRLVRLGEGSADTRRRGKFSEMVPHDTDSAQVEAIVGILVAANLIVTGRDPESDEMVLDVGHEALITNWPRFQSWLAWDRQGLRIRQQLSQAAQAWQDQARDEGGLFRGARLLETKEWVEANPGEINDLETEFLTASVTAHEAQLADLRRRNRILIAIGTAGIILAIAATIFWRQSEVAKNRAVRASTEALAGKLASQARNNLDSEADLAYLLGLTAFDLAQTNQLSDTLEIRSSILAGAASHRCVLYFLHNHTRPVISLAYSPDGKIFASGAEDNLIILWDGATGQRLREPLVGHDGWVTGLAFSPDGQTLVAGDTTGTILEWNISTGQPSRALLRNDFPVTNIVSSPDGQTLASAQDDGSVILWDITSGEPRFELEPIHDQSVQAVVFSPDGKTLVSGDGAGLIVMWDVTDGQIKEELILDDQQEVHSLAYNPTGETLVIGQGDGRISLRDAVTLEPLREPLAGHNDRVLSLAFSLDGQMMASGSEDNTIILWDTATWQALTAQPLNVHNNAVNSIAFNPDPTLDARILISGSRDTSVIVWNLSIPSPLGRRLYGHQGDVVGLAYGPDGQTFASGDTEGTIIVWDAATAQAKGDPLLGHDGEVTTLAYSPDGRTLASGGQDWTIRLWDVATGQSLGEPLLGHEETVLSIAFSPDGKLLASGSDDGTVRLWDVSTGQPHGDPLISQNQWVNSVVFSPDGQTLASTGGDELIELWDIGGGQPPSYLPQLHNAEIYALAYSPDGRLLASASEDKTIFVWDVATGQPRLDKPLTGHVGAVFGIAFRPEPTGQASMELASAGFDKTVILWDLATGEPLGEPISGHDDWIWNVAFSPDGQRLVSGSRDGTVITWDMNFESWQQLACRRANRNLTQAEWLRYVGPNIAYQPACPDLPWGN